MSNQIKKDLVVCKNEIINGDSFLKGKLNVDGNVKIGKKNSNVKLEVNGKINVSGKAKFHSLPIMTKTPYKDYHLVNKEYVDSKLGYFNINLNNLTNGLTRENISTSDDSILDKNNTWTGTNNFNHYLPTSSIIPSFSNQFVTKSYVDGLFIDPKSLLEVNNVWIGSNVFNILPTASGKVTLNNQLVTKEYVDGLFVNQNSLKDSNNIWSGSNNFNILPTTSGVVIFNNHLVTKEYVDNAISVNMNNTSIITGSPRSANNYLTFVTGTSGRQSLCVDTGIMYNTTTDTLTVVNATISGNLDATVLNATNADNINVTGTSSTNNVCSLLLVGNQSQGNQPVFIDTGLTYNGNTDTLTVSTVNGNLNGTATNATNVYVRDIISTDTMCSVLLVGDQVTGNQQPFIDGGLTYNANTDNLRASSFTGNLLGDVTGGVSATSLKVGGNNGTLIRQILLGEGVLKSVDGGISEINVGTIGITTSSKIFVTFKFSPVGISWYYVTPGTDRFIITASGAPVNDATFNWVAYN